MRSCLDRPFCLGILGALLVTFHGDVCAAANDVSRTPPAVYEEELRPLLTPLEAVLESYPKTVDESYGGIVLLNETVQTIAPDGRRVYAVHTVYKALSESGATAIENDAYTWRRETQRIHLVSAQTITPEGKRIPIRENAAFIRIPQRDAGQSIYSDDADLVVVYPDARVGSITEAVVVIEEDVFPVAGEFMHRIAWASGWPALEKRRVLEVPKMLAERLRFSRSETGAPAPEITKLGDDRVRYEWNRRNIPGHSYDVGPPPISQSGPVEWITSFADWDALNDWYVRLLHESSKPAAGLLAAVEDWTEGLADEEEIAHILHAKVANDVRYTGLEFGIAGLQPYDCNEVWKNRYGDCKDKANLLRVLLRQRGIKSRLGLVNTIHAGLIHKQAPLYQQFNHAILAIDLKNGKRLFCDPTIEYSFPGLLAPGDTDRDVLLVHDDGAEWVRTPPQDAGTLEYSFDLSLAADGEISGWLTLTARGYYAASYANYLVKRNQYDTRSALSNIVRGFYPTAEVIDVEKPTLDETRVTEYTVRAYWVVAAGETAEATVTSVTFPSDGPLFPSLGETRTRTTTYSTWKDQIRVKLSVQLPVDHLPKDQLPKPLQLHGDTLSADAHWRIESGKSAEASSDDSAEGSSAVLHAELAIVVKKALLSPTEFASAFQTQRSAIAWLKRPVALTRTLDTPRTPQLAVDLQSFPVMPSGDGQIELVQKRFPRGGNARLRREALRRVIEYFPNDRRTAFRVRTWLGIVEWDADRNEEAARLLRQLHAEVAAEVDAANYGWSRYVLGLVCLELGRNEEAKTIFDELRVREDLPENRRAWSRFQAAKLARQDESADSLSDAIAIASDNLELQVGARPDSFALLAELWILAGRVEELQGRLERLATGEDPQFGAMLQSLAAHLKRLDGNGSEVAGSLLTVVGAAPWNADNPEVKELRESITQVSDSRNLTTVRLAIQRDLTALLEELNSDRWDASLYDPFPEDRDQLEALLDADENAITYVRNAVEYLSRHEPRDVFTHHLWKATSKLEQLKRKSLAGLPADALLQFFLEALGRLPRTHDDYWEGRFLVPEFHRLAGRPIDRAASLEVLRNEPDLPSHFRMAVDLETGSSAEELAKWDEALAAYRRVEKHADDADVIPALYRAALISLERGDEGEALRIFEVVRASRADTESNDDDDADSPLEELLRLTQDPGKAKEHWKRMAAWWPRWLELRKKLDPTLDEAVTPRVVVASFESSETTGEALGAAQQRADRAAYFETFERAVHAARWIPSWVHEIGSVIALQAQSIWPETAPELGKLAIAAYEALEPVDDEWRRGRQFIRALLHFQLGERGLCYELVGDLVDLKGSNDAVAQGAARLWILSAVRQDAQPAETAERLQNPIQALERILDGAALDRALSVTVLMNAYQKLGESEKELLLLNREVKHPAVQADEARFKTISERHRHLLTNAEAEERFMAFALRWQGQHKPDWFDFSAPRSLTDPRLVDLKKVIDDKVPTLTPEERAKALLLAASDTDRFALSERQAAFLEGVLIFSEWAANRDARAMASSILDDETAPDFLKKRFVLRHGLHLFIRREPSELRSLLSHPVARELNQEHPDLLRLFDAYSELDGTTTESVGSFCRAQIPETFSLWSLTVWRSAVFVLLDLGGIKEVRELANKSLNFSFGPDVVETPATVRLGLLRAVRKREESGPAIQAIRDLLIEHEILQTAESEAAVSTAPGSVGWLPPGEAMAAVAERVRRLPALLIDPEFLTELSSLLPDDQRRLISRPLVTALVRLTPDDLERSNLILWSLGAVDIDSATELQSLQALWDEVEDHAASPLTSTAIRFARARIKQRRGHEYDISASNIRRDQPMVNYTLDYWHLVELRNRGDLGNLKRKLQSLPSEKLISGYWASLVVPALEEVGMTDELELVREHVAGRIRPMLVSGWRRRNTQDVVVAIQAATAISRPELIPRKVFDVLKSNVRNPDARHGIELVYARLYEDWPRVAEIAEALIQSHPTHYATQWYYGEALYRLERNAEALKALRVYVRYSKNEPNYRQAKEWVKALEEPEEPGGEDQ